METVTFNLQNLIKERLEELLNSDEFKETVAGNQGNRQLFIACTLYQFLVRVGLHDQDTDPVHFGGSFVSDARPVVLHEGGNLEIATFLRLEKLEKIDRPRSPWRWHEFTINDNLEKEIKEMLKFK